MVILKVRFEPNDVDQILIFSNDVNLSNENINTMIYSSFTG
jgi:hypothetical protein